MKQINLIPPEYIHLRYVRRRATVWAELVLSVSAMVGALALNIHGQLQAAEKEHQRLARKAELHRQVSMQLNSLAAEKAKLIERLTDVYAVLRKRSCAAVLYDIAAATGRKVFLSELTFDTTRRRAPNAGQAAQAGAGEGPETEQERVIVLKGYALTNLDLTRFVSRLNAVASLQSVNLRFWRQDVLDGLKLISFEIDCSPAGGR